MRNRPDRTRSRRACKVAPSNGKAPHTKTYRTTPKLCAKKKSIPQGDFSKPLGAASKMVNYSARQVSKAATNPNVHFGAGVLVAEEDFRGGIGRRSAPRIQLALG